MRNNETITRYTNEDEKGWHYSINKESQVFDRSYFRAILPIPVSETNANPILKAQQKSRLLNKKFNSANSQIIFKGRS